MNFPKPELDRYSAMQLWKENHSDYAKEQVVLNNVGMVGIVLKSLNLNPLGEDLFATGILGVVKAVNTFNPDKGFTFSTYATPIIRNEILMTFRKKRIIPAFSIDEPYEFENEKMGLQSERIADNKNFEEWIVENAQCEQFLSYLSEKERKIIRLRIDGKMQKEIAKLCGTSQSYVSRILRKIYKKWRNWNEGN